MQREEEKKFFEALQNDIQEISHRIEQLNLYDPYRPLNRSILKFEKVSRIRQQFNLLPQREKNQKFADYILDLLEWIESLKIRFAEFKEYDEKNVPVNEKTASSIKANRALIFQGEEQNDIPSLERLIETVAQKLNKQQIILETLQTEQAQIAQDQREAQTTSNDNRTEITIPPPWFTKGTPISDEKQFFNDLMTFFSENNIILENFLRPLNEFHKIKNFSHSNSVQINEFSETTLPFIAKVIKDFRIFPTSNSQQAQMQLYHYPKNILLAIELTHSIIELTKKLDKEKKSMFYGVKTFFAGLVGYEETTANELASATKMFKLVTEQQDVTTKSFTFNYSDIQCLNRGRLGSVINYYRKLQPPVLPEKFINDEKRINKQYAQDVANRLRP